MRSSLLFELLFVVPARMPHILTILKIPFWIINLKKTKIAVVIVTYNRKKLLSECLSALSRQTRLPDCIYVFDNASTDGTHDFFMKEFFRGGFSCPASEQSEQDDLQRYPFRFPAGSTNDSVSGYYLRSKVNIGGAGGFHQGIKTATKDGFDWILVMDDDAELEVDAIKQLELFLQDEDLSGSNVAALACKVIDHEGEIEAPHRGYFKSLSLRTRALPVRNYISSQKVLIDYATFVGFFINSQAVRATGLPLKHFFIYSDDVEYSLRLKKYGSIYLASKSVIIHKDKMSSRGCLFFENIPVESFWKRYYGIRNLTWLSRKYFKAGLLRTFFMILFPRIIKVIITQRNIKIKINLLWQGWKHGVQGNFSMACESIVSMCTNYRK